MTLAPEQDAYGRLMYEQLNGIRTREIIERDDGFIEANDPRIYVNPVRSWPGKRYVRGRVLDIGCGAGRHAIALQKEGYDVLGIDISPMAIKAARKLGLKRTRGMSITKIDRRLGTFDTIQMLGNNFGLVSSFKRARWLLRRFHRMTSEQSRIIAESHDVYKTSNRAHLAYHRRNRRRGRMAGQVRIRIRFRQDATPWFDYLMVSQQEMRTILRGTGWRVTRLIAKGPSPYVAVIEKDRR